MLTLILLIKGQSPKGNFEAHIFGGAALDSNDGRGHANIAMARKVLSSRGISIATEDVGGSKGRKILFDPETGHVAVLKVHSIRREDWEN